MSSSPRVGVGVLIFRGNKVLVGKRKGAHGGGEYALPGGHLEFGESFEQCATREVLEETGLQLIDAPEAPLAGGAAPAGAAPGVRDGARPKLAAGPTFQYAVNSLFDEKRHYVTVFMRGQVDEAVEPQNLEPEKCEGWEWVPWPEVPQPVFLPLQMLLESAYRPQL